MDARESAGRRGSAGPELPDTENVELVLDGSQGSRLPCGSAINASPRSI
ncbi:hypothetical protein AB0H00_13610 [Nocardia sp. NPDC023852]